MSRFDGLRGRALVPLLVILLVAISVRLLLFAYVSPKPEKLFTPDSFGYDQLALNLLQSETFSEDRELPFQPDVKRTPGYPVTIAAIYSVAGHAPEAVAVVQVLAAALTVALIYLLALKAGLPRVAALLAAFLLAVEPVSAMTSIQLLTETLFTLLLVASMLALVVWRGGSGLLWLVFSAVLLGLASLVRPVSQFLPLALVPLVAGVRLRLGPRVWLSSILLFLAVSMGVTYAWAYRNYEVSGQFTVSTVSDVNLLFYRAREVVAAVDGVSQEEALARLEARVPRDASTAERASIERAEALAVFREHPGQTLVMFGKGAARMFVDPGFTSICTQLDRESTALECFPGEATMDEAGIAGKVITRLRDFSPVQDFVLVWSVLLSAAIYVAAIVGTLVLVRRRRWFAILTLLTVAGYLVAVSAGSEAYSRFRIPILPELSVLAGMGAMRLVAARRLAPAREPALARTG